jgi:hypothetical protein
MPKLGDAPGWEKMSASAKCQKCGKPVKDSKYKLCYECSQKSKGDPGGATREQELPKGCIFASFYDEGGHLRREIFIEAAKEASEVFMRANISQTSIRNLFNLLKDMSNRLQADRNLDFGTARETFYKFVRQVEYNVKRQVLHPVFQVFAERHLEVSTTSKKEFLGFVEYLTSIVARLKSK